MRNNFKRELKDIEIPNELHERTKIGVMRAKAEKPKNKIKKFAIPFIASGFILLSAGVGAAQIPSFNKLIAIISPEVASFLQPIETSSESDGINMEVVAAMSDDEMAVIYLTLQDLTGNRIDKTIDLYDYTLSGTHMLNSQVVDFDETTDTATLRIQANGGEDLTDEKASFHLSSFLSEKQTVEAKVNADLSESASKQAKTIPLDMNNIPGGSGDLFQKLESNETVQVLKPNQNNIQLPGLDFINISNLGIIDDRFHVQAKWSGNDIDAHGYFYFVDSLNNKIHPSTIEFELNETGQITQGNKYTEYVFDKNNVNFEEQDLLGHFVSNGKHVTGNWNTTFKMQSVQDKKINRNLIKNFGSWHSKSISISPLGVTIYGQGEIKDSANIKVSAKMSDGTVKVLDSMFNYSDNEEITAKFVSSLPIEVSEVKSVIINGTKISIEN